MATATLEVTASGGQAFRLFEVETGGATYWVAARDVAGAREMVRADCLENGDDEVSLDAIEMDETAGCERFIRDGDQRWTLWEEFGRASEQCILACSEWD